MALASPFLAPDDTDEMGRPEPVATVPAAVAFALAGACSSLAYAVAIDAGLSPLVLGGSMGFLGLCAWQPIAYSLVADGEECADACATLPERDVPTTPRSPPPHDSAAHPRVRPDTIAARVRARHRSATQ